MDKVNEYLKKNSVGYVVNNKWYPEPTKPILCKDGFELSIQANNFAYCTPRRDRAWPYTTVELGYPNQPDELIEEFAENSKILTDTVYGFVPIDIVNQLIDKHGGIAE